MKLILVLFILVFTSLSQKDIKLVKVNVLKDKVSIFLPHDFGLMSEKVLKLKYPSPNRPKIVYSNEKGSINFAFNHTTSNASFAQLPLYKDYLVKTFEKTYPTAKWLKKEMTEVNGVTFGVMEFISPAADTKIYNLMYFTSVSGKLLICSFNCMLKQMPKWRKHAKKMYK